MGIMGSSLSFNLNVLSVSAYIDKGCAAEAIESRYAWGFILASFASPLFARFHKMACGIILSQRYRPTAVLAMMARGSPEDSYAPLLALALVSAQVSRSRAKQ